MAARYEIVSYSSAHRRLYETRGSASRYQCSAPGCVRTARDWAYDGTDPNPFVEYKASGHPLYYSTDPNRYQPLCRSCHRRSEIDPAAVARIFELPPTLIGASPPPPDAITTDGGTPPPGH